MACAPRASPWVRPCHSAPCWFRSFSQAEASTSKKYGGTGLGLALTRRFCHSMGGTVEVESEVGVGSSFKIEIPTAPRRIENAALTSAPRLRKAASGR